MAVDYSRLASAKEKRQEQLKRWLESDTEREPTVPKRKRSRVKFQEGCVFLAACAAGDTEEVGQLLTNGADINTANVDGLTALHQACIDDNMDMVKFLVEKEADMEYPDNEGWTALHATVSCGHLEITQYLIESGADLSAVNNEGETPLDLAEDEEMEQLIHKFVEHQSIDLDAARREEERRMIEDANQWLNSRVIKEKKHSKSGASALHVAAAKGYIKVMQLLIQAGVPINAVDNDGWTPLHAAAHWGQKEACEVLAESMCNMNVTNFAGQSPFDIADVDVLPYLEELKKRQATIKKERPAEKLVIDITNEHEKAPLKRSMGSQSAPFSSYNGPADPELRTSVSRISLKDKTSFMQDISEERRTLESSILKKNKKQASSSEESSSEESSEETNRVDKERRQGGGVTLTRITPADTNQHGPTTTPTAALTHKPSDTDATATAAAASRKVLDDKAPTSWRAGLRKTGSSSAVPETNNGESKDKLQRSPSTPSIFYKPWEERLKEREKDKERERKESREDRLRRLGIMPPETKDNKDKTESREDRLRRLGILPPADNKDKDKDNTANTDTAGTSLYMRRKGGSESETAVARTGSSLTVTQSTAPSTVTTTTSTSNRRSYLAPQRDEESETQRKARSRRARETRRSTQGVTMDDLEAAEKTIRKDKEEKERRDKEGKENGTAKEVGLTGLHRQGRLGSGDYSVTTGPISTATPPNPPSVTITEAPDIQMTPDQDQDQNKGDKDKKLMSSQSARRRPREKRRSTGIPASAPTEDDGGSDETPSQSQPQENLIADGERTRSRYDTGTSSYLSRSTGSYRDRYGPYDSVKDKEKDKDYKKLYEDAVAENEKLKEKVNELKTELAGSKVQMERDKQRRDRFPDRSLLLETEKREKRALERRISEMEEELKQLADLRADNQRLKDENGALIRVISKLSK
ncbi:protein phosphatase 1 regulatory subunit 12A-like isoform X2 [Branchiostoma floridae]|uniref:Protein phosphatase 1 regulatory subunit 12B n=1 Tax=Branchiostoma floridae TaxID=7739 RepID=A0A9J7HTE5_BRAFL|nr:protein phosphatase 1 regulatory subunit 12A-like isoform X2 [Branchiostoma floridae]